MNLHPAVWEPYLKLHTKYQEPSICSCWENCDESICFGQMDRQKNGQTAPKQYTPSSSKQGCNNRNFGQAFLRNHNWEWFEIWQDGLVWCLVRWKGFLGMSNLHFLFALLFAGGILGPWKKNFVPCLSAKADYRIQLSVHHSVSPRFGFCGITWERLDRISWNLFQLLLMR